MIFYVVEMCKQRPRPDLWLRTCLKQKMKTCVCKQSNNLKREINKDEEKGKVCIAEVRNPND